MKSLLLALSLVVSATAFAKDPYSVTKNPWGGESEVRLNGVTGDLFATHELVASKGPAWKKTAESYIENKTDATEALNKIEDGTISEACNIDWEQIDYVEADSLTYKWKALKPVRQANAATILYVVETYGRYIVKMNKGKSITCPYLINEYVFLNPMKFLGVIAE